MQYQGKGTFRLCRWIAARRDWHEFDSVNVSLDPDQRFAAVKVAAIGDDLSLFVNDQLVTRT